MMLRCCGGLTDSLVQCLLLGANNSRRSQAGADPLQEAAAGALHELSLFGPWKQALKADAGVVIALRELLDVGTKRAKESAAAALFELDDEARARAPSAHSEANKRDDGAGTGMQTSAPKLPPPHVMASYNWDHQDVILRVVGSLQSRGYLVWVDTEQMKGAAVDTMALAVEGSAVVLIGASRAYKESSNCRMEAQYALQKKKQIVPLMLTQGYEADGWLGLLLGTSMWYAFYGEPLQNEARFDERMDALCREIGTQGRADAAAACEPELEPAYDLVPDSYESLREELRRLRLKQLRQRATAEGMDEDTVDRDALDADNPKAALIDLLVEHMASRGPAEQVLSSLEAGGEACAEVLGGVLDNAMDVLDAVSVSSPRRARKGVFEAVERVESVLETVDAEWCDGVSRCSRDELDRLSGLVVRARGLLPSSAGIEACDIVSEMLDCLDRCGSVVVQSVAVLSGSESDAELRVCALETIRGLSEARLDSACADEAAVYEAVKGNLSGLDACVGDEVVSSCMAMFTLGCRNGMAICGTLELCEVAGKLVLSWLNTCARLSAGAADYAAGAASSALYHLNCNECGYKQPPEARAPLEKAESADFKRFFETSANVFTEQRVREVFVDSMKAGILSHKDVSLASGWCGMIFYFSYMWTGALSAANEAGVFGAGLALYRRVEPSPLPAEWWSSTCDVADVTSARQSNLWLLFTLAKRLPSATQTSWWSALLDRAIHTAKINASAGLSGRKTMAWLPVVHALGIVDFAARDETQHEILIGIMDALEYGILHDFSYVGISIAANASGAAVTLVGRNEGGKTLRREAVHAVLEQVHQFFQPDSWGYTAPPKSFMAHAMRIPIMTISDANKTYMLQFEPLVDMLLQCLIVDDDNHRKGQDSANALQEASAGVLQELALFGPGAVALRSHSDAVKTLHKLCEVGTKVSKERGAAALFELEQDKRPKTAATDGGVGPGLHVAKGKPPLHVMASYNWDHQDVILRMVGSLQSRGYLVWVDTEQMKGAAVDTMALAVEGSAVVLIGASRAYKESSNCRMEAQYALQKKKQIVPLMLTQGYEADGWLGLLLGTSMWYALYGESLSSESAFEGRIDALCREIGTQGRADAVAANAQVSCNEPEPAEATAFTDELRALRVRDLLARACEAGLNEDDVLDAQDSGDCKEALIMLFLQQRREMDGGLSGAAQRTELASLGIRELLARAKALPGLDAAAVLETQLSDDPKGAIVELLLRH